MLFGVKSKQRETEPFCDLSTRPVAFQERPHSAGVFWNGMYLFVCTCVGGLGGQLASVITRITEHEGGAMLSCQ